MPRLLSVNVGLPREIEWHGQNSPHRDLEVPGFSVAFLLGGSIWTAMARATSQVMAANSVP